MNPNDRPFILCPCGKRTLLPLPKQDDSEARQRAAVRRLLGRLINRAPDLETIARRVIMLDFIENNPEPTAEKRRKLMERFGLAKSSLSEAEARAKSVLEKSLDPNIKGHTESF